MKNTMLAILAVALAALAPFALAAEGDSDKDDGGVSQPTLRQLANKIDHVVRRLGAVEATVGTLATATAVDALTTEVRTHASAATANHTTIVGKFDKQMAVVMSVPQWWSGFGTSNSELLSVGSPRHYLVGESTIPGFPAGTVGADGLFTDRTLPAGTYLFELQQPYGDNTICQRALSRRHLSNTNDRHKAACPRVRLHPFINRTRLEDGYGIYTYAAPASFQLRHYWPPGLKFSEDTRLSATDRANAKPMSSYTGAVRITKLK